MKSPLSQAQLGVYYACLSTVSGEYNYQNPVLFDLPQDVDLARLQESVHEALCAHPYLFSHVVVNDEGRPEMETPNENPNVNEVVPVREVSEAEWAEVQKTFAQTMDIQGERLYRAEIYVVDKRSYLYLDTHHVVTDGLSVAILIRDIERVYNGKKPAGEMMDGAAVALAEEEQRHDDTLMTEAREWYAKNFCDAADTDSLPIPAPQPPKGGAETPPLGGYRLQALPPLSHQRGDSGDRETFRHEGEHHHAGRFCPTAGDLQRGREGFLLHRLFRPLRPALDGYRHHDGPYAPCLHADHGRNHCRGDAGDDEDPARPDAEVPILRLSRYGTRPGTEQPGDVRLPGLCAGRQTRTASGRHSGAIL